MAFDWMRDSNPQGFAAANAQYGTSTAPRSGTYGASAYDPNGPYMGGSHTANGVQLVPGAAGYDAAAAAPWHQQIAQTNAGFGIPGAVGSIQDTWSGGAGGGGGTTGGLGGLGGFDMSGMLAQQQQQQQSMQDMLASWQKGFGAQQGANPNGGGSFSGSSTSPVYKPTGDSKQPANGFGGMWGSSPFRPSF